MRLGIIGSGYVGLVTGACLADLGNTVICMDSDESKIKRLRKGDIPIYEPGLEEMIRRNNKEGRLSFTADLKETVKKSDIIFICVGTPPRDNGEADLSFVENVARDIAFSMPSYRLIVEKSTVPVNTGEWIGHIVDVANKKNVKFDVASNPEFLREGSAINDFMHPDRIVIGAASKKAREMLLELYKPLNAQIVLTDIKSAELIKHASNSFLAAKISFINSIANICDKVGADISEVAKGMGMDKRIGEKFLTAGIGFGGFCFPKDLSAFIRISEKLGYDFGILKQVQVVNDHQKKVLMEKIEDALWNLAGKTVGILGLSFKPDTDDIRYAPSLDIIASLLKEKARVKAYDPVAMARVKKVFGKDVKFCKDAYSTAEGSDCPVVVTEWNEFKELDFNKIKRLMRQPIIVDGRNIYNPAEIKKMGFKYTGIGRR
ncbi:MAG: UDP-glucose/GDP-mannose dehydrogenase family protein [Candidatus Omnitrophica bacterium]|nr:UDP-glucose/GDP-mannose dehydrogenase family protein [Candidatus Omnitrophota bacterium]